MADEHGVWESGDDEVQFGLVAPFHIDDGELDGLSPQMCFVLGCEFQLVRSCMTSALVIKEGGPFTEVVHLQNRERLTKLADLLGFATSTALADPDDPESKIDQREGWIWMTFQRRSV